MLAFPNANEGFPKFSAATSHQVMAEERVTAIDFVNRHNFLFEEFDTKKLLTTQLPEMTLYHMYGHFQGAEAVKDFIESKYPPLIPGVTRHATNHIVDRDNETGGVVVRYHMTLVRQAWPEEAGKVTTKDAFEVTGLPGIWIYSAVVDRLKMTDDGWKLYSRINGSTVVNKSLNPGASETSKRNAE